MIKATVYNWKKEVVGNLNLPPEWFNQELNMYLIHEVVRSQRAAYRQGTHKAKTRGEVSGGGKKPFRQKGTGNARQGSIRSPLNVAGGKTFGPRPRKYTYTLPAKIRQMGLRQALSYLWKQNKIFIVENMQSSAGKTKELAHQLKNLGLQKALLVDIEENPLLKRACANLPSFQFLPVKALNVYDVLKYQHVVMNKESVQFFQNKPVRVKSNLQKRSEKRKSKKIVAKPKKPVKSASALQGVDSKLHQKVVRQQKVSTLKNRSDKESSVARRRSRDKKSPRTVS